MNEPSECKVVNKWQMNQPTLSGVIKIANIRLKILTMTLSTQIPIPAALS